MKYTGDHKKVFRELNDFWKYKDNHVVNVYIKDSHGLVGGYMSRRPKPDHIWHFIDPEHWKYPFDKETTLALHFLDRDFVCFFVPNEMPKGIIIGTGKKTNVIKNREFEIVEWGDFLGCIDNEYIFDRIESFDWFEKGDDYEQRAVRGEKYDKDFNDIYDLKVSQLLWSLCIVCSMNMGVIGVDRELKLDKESRRKIQLPNNTIKNDGVDIYKICIIKPKFYGGETFGLSVGIKYREHIRRGHWRHYKNGHKVFINSYIAGDKRLGVITKDYKLQA